MSNVYEELQNAAAMAADASKCLVRAAEAMKQLEDIVAYTNVQITKLECDYRTEKEKNDEFNRGLIELLQCRMN